ncbi:hypothetical protein G6F31_020895 [Rhizopus arrhizus]|nr:hypothetical protein G6F31_020895 [Rhizopus arrhizus]
MGHFRGMRGTVSSLARELDELRLGSAGKLFIGSIMAASPGHLTDALLRLKQTYPLPQLPAPPDRRRGLVGHRGSGSSAGPQAACRFRRDAGLSLDPAAARRPDAGRDRT